MGKKYFCRFAFGLALLIFLILPLMPCDIANTTIIAQAGSTEDSLNSIKLNVSSKSLVKDTTYDLKVYNLSNDHKVYFKSDSPSIASVNKKGEVTGNKVGTALITVIVKDGFRTIASLECDIIVGPPAISIKLTKSVYTLTVGKRTSLKGILKPDNSVENIRFVSSNSEIASVSSTGKVTAKNVGDVYIFAIIANGNRDYCKIIVTDQLVESDEEEEE